MSRNAVVQRAYYMHEAIQRVDNHEQQLELLTKAMVGPGTRAEHGHPRGNRSMHTEEKEDVGYTSKTCSILRTLQKNNKSKRLEGEVVMSAPPFFHSLMSTAVLYRVCSTGLR